MAPKIKNWTLFVEYECPVGKKKTMAKGHVGWNIGLGGDSGFAANFIL
jgi:hypothetical protein